MLPVLLSALLQLYACCLLTSVTNIKKKKTNGLLALLNEAATQYNLSFSSQEILKNRIIGVDGISRKLIIAEEQNDINAYDVIDLEEVKSCKMKRNYTTVNMGDKKTEEHLSAIVLQFHFKNGKEAHSLPFYNDITNHIYEIAELENKAKDWEAMLSKMLTAQAGQRA